MSEEIRIILSDETAGGGEASAPVATTGGGGETPMAPVSEKGAKAAKKKGSSSMGLVAVRTVTPYISKAAQFGVSQIEMMTGSAELQRKAEYFVEITGKIGSIGTAAAAGGWAGAAAAVGQLIAETAMESAMRSIQVYFMKKEEKENLALRRSRLGASINHSRTGGTL